MDDPRVVTAMETVCAAAKRYQRPVGVYLSSPEEVALGRDKGATLFPLGSDHVFLLRGAAELHRSVNSPG